MTLTKTAHNAPSRHNLDLHPQDEKFMRLALIQASLSEKHGDVPIGAVIVDKNGKVIAKSSNIREKHSTTLGHAELVAIHRACQHLNSWRLLGCTLYVTLEPCYMCAGALVQSRISRVVFGADDPKGGALKSLDQLGQHKKLNHQFEVTGGVLAKDSSELLKTFFKKRRNSIKENKKKGP
jgi:tRNA(adenine34) deaminase